jgi:hypothetical protein
MQGPSATPTEGDQASIPTEHALNSPNLNRTFTVRRKAAKRTFPWELTADEIQLALPRPQDEDTRETKRPRRLEEPVPTSTEASSKTTTIAIFPPDAAADHHTDSDPVMDMHLDTRTRARRRWTPEEDVKLTTAVTNTRKKKLSKNWDAIAALVPNRTKDQCQNRWRWCTLDPSIDRTNGGAGKWKEDEDINLEQTVQKLGSKDWVAIAALVPGRTRKQCNKRWHDILDPSIDRVTGIRVNGKTTKTSN